MEIREYKRNRNFLKVIFFLGVLILFIFALIFHYYVQGISEKYSESREVKRFVIGPGQSSEEISENLQQQGLIKSSLYFNVYAWQTGLDSRLQAGEYDIPQNLNIREIMRILTRARARNQYKITIIEGWNIRDIAKYLEKRNIFSQEKFLEKVRKKQDWWDVYSLVREKPKEADLEGYLFPDTYLVFEDASLDDIIEKMLSTLEKKITPEMRAQSEKNAMTFHEALTLASIIEKEVSGSNDRKIVSGIFHKRLKLGIGLQADSTVNYVTGKNALRSTRDDILIDNPYNTYKYRGLPPGPIANPGLDAISAALNPEESPYLYFLTTPQGEVIYSKTFDEHISAKKKYL